MSKIHMVPFDMDSPVEAHYFEMLAYYDEIMCTLTYINSIDDPKVSRKITGELLTKLGIPCLIQ